jgi:hypothetical protein
MGKRSREKGKSGEREARDVLQRWGLLGARRGVQYRGGPESPDVVGFRGVHVEVKRVNALNLRSAMAQAIEEASEDHLPIVLSRADRHPWILHVYADEFPRLVKLFREALAAEEEF